jgi:hypothetical protein
MKKARAMKWVRALRSGKYKQGTGSLKRQDSNGDDCFCCLGVLAEINKVGDEFLCREDLLNTSAVQNACNINSFDGTPMSDEAGDYDTEDEKNVKIRVKNKTMKFTNLAAANDEGATFHAIASWIEKNYKLL